MNLRRTHIYTFFLLLAGLYCGTWHYIVFDITLRIYTKFTCFRVQHSCLLLLLVAMERQCVLRTVLLLLLLLECCVCPASLFPSTHCIYVYICCRIPLLSATHSVASDLLGVSSTLGVVLYTIIRALTNTNNATVGMHDV